MKKSPERIQKLQQKEGRIVCPSCGELLSTHDVESFGKCPFCDHKFLLDGNMEDFLLKSVIENWCQTNLAAQTQQFSSEQDSKHSNWI